MLFPATRLQHLVEMQISWGCLRFEIRLGIPERSAFSVGAHAPAFQGPADLALLRTHALRTHAGQLGLHSEFQSVQGYKHSEALSQIIGK